MSIKPFEIRTHVLKDHINKYTILGLCLSIISIIIASMLASYQQSGFMDLASFILAQKTNPALWALDFTPFLFAFWGQSFCYELANTMETLLEDKTRDLVNKSSELELKLRHQTTHDRLTNLPNQQLLAERITQGIQHIQKTDDLAVIVLHINAFKEINQKHGSFNANNILIQFAEKLKTALLEPYFLQPHLGINMVARLQGAEFAILMPRLKKDNNLDDILHQLLTAVSINVMIDGKSVPITTTAGVAIYPQHGTDDLSLLRHATASLFYAESKNIPYALYDVSMDEGKTVDPLKIKELSDAIDAEKMKVWYQPVFLLKTEVINGAEACLYFDDDQNGTRMAERASVLFEGSDLLKKLTLYTFKNAIKQLASWHKKNHKISVTVSLLDVTDMELPNNIQSMLKSHHIEPEYLKIELTERVCLSDQAKSTLLLKALSDLGVKIVISDFGSGYAPFTYLANFPISEIKIDKSFVLTIASNEKRLRLVKAMVALAASMDVAVCADGIVDQKIMTLLKKMRCLYGQGAYLSEPLDAKAFFELLNQTEKS